MKIITNKYLLATFFSIISFVIFKSYVNASDVLGSDNFDDGVDDGWTKIHEGGTNLSGNWSFVTGKTGYMYGLNVTSQFTVENSLFGSEKWQDYSVKFDMLPKRGSDKNFMFRYNSPTPPETTGKWYELHISGTDALITRIGIGPVLSPTKHINIENGTLYNWIITAKGTHITISYKRDDESEYINLFDFDDTYPNPLLTGRIGIRIGSGTVLSEVYFDNIVVTDLTEPPKPVDYVLNTPFFSQIDPLWKEKKYDHSDWWVGKNNGSIGRWGCAMTSAAMTLKENGYPVGPDNQETNPDNLNQYLIGNLYGYNEWGGIIWPTITEYARKTVENGRVPADTKSLEFSYLAYNHDNLIDQLNATHSSILKIRTSGQATETKDDDGYHFVVAKGYTNPDKNIILNDPLASTDSGVVLEASYSGKTVVNMIQFKPSHTDLSYLWFSTDMPNTLSLTKNGQPVTLTDTTYYLDGGITDGTGKPSPYYKTLAIPKPDTGKYILTLTAPTVSIVKLDATLFDQGAKAKRQVSKLIVGPQFSRTFVVNYNHDDISKTKIKPQYSILTLRQMIEYAHRNKWLRGGSYAHLRQILANIDWHSKHHSPHTKTLLRVCDWYLPVGRHLKWIDSQAEELIHAEIEGLLEN